MFKPLKPTGILFCALILLAGCATTKKWPEETISAPDTTHGDPALNWADAKAVKQPPPPLSVKQPPAKKTVNSPPPVVRQTAPAEPVRTWVPLHRWTALHNTGTPHFLTSAPLTTYAISSLNGVMILAVGSKKATWNGMEIQLGFEPQLIDGEIYVHGLDLQKNLEPLLSAPPLTFGTNRVIVVDPGHGGMNSGTKSVLAGRYEKDFTLDWAKRLKPLLEANGWQVFLTRTNDVEIPIYARIAFADAHHADVFISLHFNSAAPDTKQSGLETYSLTPTGMASTLTRGYDDPVWEIYAGNQYDAQNLQLAVSLHNALLHATGEEDRSVRRARFMGVLTGQHRPAILIEGGYLSNPQQARRIEDPEFRQKLAEAVAGALK